MAEMAITHSRIGADEIDVARLMEMVRCLYNIVYAIADLEPEELTDCDELAADMITKCVEAVEKSDVLALEGLEKYLIPED